jgi:Glycosyl transferase family 2
MKIAVVIPTYKNHFCFLEGLLINISEQTRLPDMVIIRASSCDAPLDISRNWPFPLKILETPAKQFAGQNRNEGADAVPDDFDAVSFIDSDDYMHPRRLEMTEPLLEQGADAIYHCCEHGPRGPIAWEDADPAPVWDCVTLKPTLLWLPVFKKHIDFLQPMALDEDLSEEIFLHCGHPTLRLSCFKAVRFDEMAYRYEDTKLFSDIVYKRYNIVTLKNKLSYFCSYSEEELNHKFSIYHDASGSIITSSGAAYSA